MSTSLRDIQQKLSKLSGKITKDNALEIHGSKESIELFSQQVEATKKVLARENYETYGETPLLDLSMEKTGCEQIRLIGNWQVFEKFLEKYGVKIDTEVCTVVHSKSSPELV